MSLDTLLYYCDGSVDAGRCSSGVAVVVRNSDGQILDAASCYLKGMTNNEAEYQALILGLELALARGDPAKQIVLLSDSQVGVGQVWGRYAVRDTRLQPHYRRAAALLKQLPGARVAFVPRALNRLFYRAATASVRSAQCSLPLYMYYGTSGRAGIGWWMRTSRLASTRCVTIV